MTDDSVTTEAAADREFTWDETQLTAINRCCDMQQRVVPVTGVAGTGKTTLIREIFARISDAGYRVVLCAPTGKAAKRMTEATGLPAMTIHRLLEYPHPGERDPDTGRALVSTVPKRDKDNPVAYQVVLCDEYAMVNREVHRNLIDALPAGGRICMFGDVNQLKPIENKKFAGKESPFQAGLRQFNGTVLERIHRTVEGSGIAANGERILSGRVPLRKEDFVLRVTEQPVHVLTDVVMEALEDGINYGTNAGQIISPTKKSWVGTYKLNVLLQGLLNPLQASARIKLPRNTWDKNMPIHVGIGDKVIWTENAYDLRDWWDRFEDEECELFIPPPPDKVIMNGESGVITKIDDNNGVVIDVGDRLVEVPPVLTVPSKRKQNELVQYDPRRTIDLGFCITTHKAQGSEWPHVIYVLNASTTFMQSRHNFYTGVSRARQTATVVTDQKSLQNSVFNTIAPVERM